MERDNRHDSTASGHYHSHEVRDSDITPYRTHYHFLLHLNIHNPLDLDKSYALIIIDSIVLYFLHRYTPGHFFRGSGHFGHSRDRGSEEEWPSSV